MATVAAEGSTLHVGRSGANISIEPYELDVEAARQLIDLIDLALSADAPVKGLLGSVPLAGDPRPLYVRKWPVALSFSRKEGPTQGGRHVFILRGQVEELRAALAAAVDSATVIEPDTREQVNAELPALTTTVTRTPSNAPARSAPGMQRV